MARPNFINGGLRRVRRENLYANRVTPASSIYAFVHRLKYSIVNRKTSYTNCLIHWNDCFFFCANSFNTFRNYGETSVSQNFKSERENVTLKYLIGKWNNIL